MTTIRKWMASSKVFFIIWCMLAAFGTYFCMYALRKPFNAGLYQGYHLWHIDYKAILIIAQVLGYMASKFIGIKVISELRPENRQKLIICLILVAELGLLLFGLIPPPYNFACLFLNGLPLGMIWGIIFSYLEGRRFTEVLSMGLSASLVVSSGLLKTCYFAVRSLLPNVSEFWMPAVMGLISLPLFLLFVWMLSIIPAPTPDDIQSRAKRLPMDRQDKRKVLRDYGWGIVSLVIVYALLTTLRDFRDNFAVEVWNEMDPAWNKEVFAQTELISGLIVIIAIGSLSAIRNSMTAFFSTMALILAGLLLSGAATCCFRLHWISPFVWMLLLGMGLFLAYIPIQVVLFERMIALFRIKANAGFFVYICDSFGYLGSVALLLYKEFFVSGMSWTRMLMRFSILETVVAAGLTILSALFFYRQYRSAPKSEPIPKTSI